MMKVLVVDDSKADVMLLKNMLKDYDLLVAYDGVEAMECLAQDPEIGIMILDLNMPRMNGYEVLEALGRHPEYKKIATLILTNYDEIDNEIRGLELGAVDYIRKPLNFRSLRKRIELHSNLVNARKELEQHNYLLEKAVQDRTRELNQTRDVAIHALVSLLEVRNVESSNHTQRTQWMMKALCEHLRTKEQYKAILTDAYIDELFNTAPLHDIGKVGIPDCILLKPGRLTAEEFEIMKKHVVFGVEALRSRESGGCSLSFIRTAMEIAATHHEKFNGSGYPNNLAGKDIPLSGRLMAIIDVYDALVSERVYKAAYSHEEAMELIAQEKGRHFDPDIVDAFFEIQADIKKIADTFIPHRP
jgi:putative two-component system response regulator